MVEHSMETGAKKVVDLFSGCGGLSKGFEKAGFDIVAAFEFDKNALTCYNANFSSHKAHKQDLSDVVSSILRIKPYCPDIIIGGPPCQDFSTAGRRIEGKRAALTEAFANIVQGIRPQYFIMENVSRAKDSDSYSLARGVFKKSGYGLTEKIVNASLFGVPQNRKRFIVIGSLNDRDSFLDEAIECQESLISMTVRMKYPDFPIEYYYRHPRTYQRRGIFSIDEPAPTVRGVNRPRPSNYVPHNGDRSKDGNIRALTSLERARIQTFPENFIWPDLKSAELDQMIGNAVPVDLAEKVASALAHHINGNSLETVSASFYRWLIESRNLTPESAKDVISNLRRANSFAPFNEETLVDKEYITILKNADRYKALPRSAQNHINRAITLLSDYNLQKVPLEGAQEFGQNEIDSNHHL